MGFIEDGSLFGYSNRGVTMSKARILAVLGVLSCLLYAQDEMLVLEAQRIRTVADEILNTLQKEPQSLSPDQRIIFAKLEPLPPEHKLDAWIYLTEKGDQALRRQDLSAMLRSGEVRRADNNKIAEHLLLIYNSRNRDFFEKPNPENLPLLAATLTIADRFDGTTDASLNYEDVGGLYTLLVEKQTPISALCYLCRDEDAWTDVRTLLTTSKLEKNLPREILNLKKQKLTDYEKLVVVTRYLGTVIEYDSEPYSTDFWQTPFETLLLGNGDCEDFALLLQSIAMHLNIQTRVVVGTIILPNGQGQVLQVGHAWVEHEGRIFDPSRRDRQRANYLANIRFDASAARFMIQGEGDTRFESQMVAGK